MKEILFNLNFDDFHPQTDEFGDFGGDLENGNFRYIRQLLDEFPKLKVTLFTTPNWVDKPMTRGRWYYYLRRAFFQRPVVLPFADEPFRLDKHPKWCEAVRELIRTERVEITVHGLHHHNPSQTVHGQEFSGLSYEESRKRIKEAEELLWFANFRFVRIFRPPGWGISDGLLLALRNLQYDAIAVEPSHSRTAAVGDYEGLRSIPSNYSIKEKPEVALQQAEQSGAVFAKGHMSYRYGKEIIENGLTEEFYGNIRAAIQELEKNYEVKFVTLKELISSIRRT